jgi:UDP-galactose transporter B1
MSRSELFVCVVGIYIFFLTWGLTQERLTSSVYSDKKFRHFIFLNWAQATMATLIAYIYILLRGKGKDKMTFTLCKRYLLLAVFHCVASPFGYESLKYIDYPTQILGKSCKLIPTIIMNFVIYKKIETINKYLIAIIVTIGVATFTLQQPSKSLKQGQNSAYGLMLLTVNLLIDGATSATQGTSN